MKKLSYRLFLYSPAAAAVTLENSSAYFLGELYADNVNVNIKLQEVSTISFTLPQFINGVENPRLNEVLDNYVIELWYGKIDTDTFEKIRFVIYKTPQEFNEEKYLYNYSGYSLESLLEFKNLVNWPGIPIRDFYRIITYNNTADPSDAFTETNQSNLSILENTATNPVKYIKVAPSNDNVDPLDILIYETRKNLEDEITSRASLISYESTEVDPYNDDGFKPGYYYLELGVDGLVDFIYIALPENIVEFDGLNLSDRSFSYHLYDNPYTRLYASGINKNTGDSQNNWYLDVITQEGAAGDTTTYEGFTYTFQEDDYKNGLTLEQILIGEQFPSSTTPTSSGILFGTGFKLGEIHAQTAALYRSNLEFNNLTRYQAIKQVAETFDSIAVFNTVDNTVSFYPEIIEDGETDPWDNNGLVLRYGAYLKSLQKDIDASKIITMAQGIGKDNIPISLVTPTGDNFWEDYSYFLDDYYIDPSQTIADLISAGFSVSFDGTKGLSITYPAGTRESKWMPVPEAQAIAQWQYTRGYFHNLLLGEVSPINSAHNKYEDLYTDRLEALNAFVKLQTEVEQKLALKFKYFTLKEHYIKQNKNNPGTYDDKEVEYTKKYNEASFQVGNARRRLKKLENLVYDLNQDGSTNYVFYADATTTNGSAIVNLAEPNFDLVVGAAVSGSGIPVGATIDSIENGLRFTLSANATATVNINNAVRLTFTESLPESYAHKLSEIKTILNKNNWSIDLDALKSFQREAVVTDSKIDNEFELLKSVIKHVEENKRPIVTIQTGVADILAAEEAYQDWDKVKVGEKIYLFLPNLNVDQESLVREISIDFEGNSLSFVISTVRNYNKNILSSAFKLVRELKNSERNFSNYIYDKVNYGSTEEIPSIEENIESGNVTNQTGPTDENGNAPQNDQEGGETPEIDEDSIDETTETFEYKYTTGVTINGGKVLSFKQYTPEGEDPYTIETELSAANGFEIRRIDGSAENGNLDVTKQVYIDPDGNAVFSGFVSVNQDDNVGYDKEGVFIGEDNGVSKFSLVSGNTSMVFDPSATDYKLKVLGEAKIGPLTLGAIDGTFVTGIVGSDHPKISSGYLGSDVLTEDYTFTASEITTIAITHFLQQFGGTITARSISIQLFLSSSQVYPTSGSVTIDIPDTAAANLVEDTIFDIPNINTDTIRVTIAGTVSGGGATGWSLQQPKVTTPSADIKMGNFIVDSQGVMSTTEATFGNSSRDRIRIKGSESINTPFVTTIQPGNLTEDRTITIPNVSGTILVNTADNQIEDILVLAADDITITANDNFAINSTINDIELTAADNIDLNASNKVEINATNGVLIYANNPKVTIATTTTNTADGPKLEFLENTTSNFGETGNFGFRFIMDGSANQLKLQSANGTAINDRIVVARDSGFTTINGYDVWTPRPIGTETESTPGTYTGYYNAVNSDFMLIEIYRGGDKVYSIIIEVSTISTSDNTTYHPYTWTEVGAGAYADDLTIQRSGTSLRVKTNAGGSTTFKFWALGSA